MPRNSSSKMSALNAHCSDLIMKKFDNCNYIGENKKIMKSITDRYVVIEDLLRCIKRNNF